MKEKTISVVLLLTLVLFAGMIQVNIARAPIPSGWAVVLTAALGDYHDESTFGVESDATECFDPAYDEFDPPEPPTGVVSHFWHPSCPLGPPNEQKLMTSIIPPSECVVTWTYWVKPKGLEGDMCISWSASDIASIPPECSVFLDGVNMRDTTEHCFAAVADTTYPFTIEVSTQYDLTIEVVGIGNTDPAPGIHPYDCCTDVTVDAIQTQACYRFDHWDLDGVDVGDADPYTIHIDNHHTLTAVFVKIQYELTIEVAPDPDDGDTDPPPGIHPYDCCTDVTVTAIETIKPFRHWNLDGTFFSVDPSVTIHIDNHHTLTAVFTQPYDLTIEVVGIGTTDPAPGIHPFDFCTDVTVDAIETDPCYRFDHWDLDGVDVGDADPYTIHIDNHHTLTAVFVKIPYDLTIEFVGTGTTDPSPDIYVIDCCTDVTVDAIETDPCWMFYEWNLDGAFVSADPSVTIHMDTDHILTAVFVKIPYDLTIEFVGTGTTDPSPDIYVIDCCTDVTVDAIETDPCWMFDHWELDGVDVGSADPYSLHMDDHHTLTAVFVKIPYDLTIEVVGTGTTDPPPDIYVIDCCTDVTVTAIETDGPFNHWELDGGFLSPDPSVTIHMDDHHTLTAVFVGWNVVLTASKEGYSDISDFGVRDDATDCFDPAYDEIDPPEPPTGVVSYFWHACCPSTPVDQRKLATSKIAPAPLMMWTYKVKPINIDGLMCISWSAGDIASIPLELGVYLHCPDCTVINMRMVTEYCFEAETDTTYTFTIGVGGCSFELHLSAGWNMVSFPCLPDDPSFSNILCGIDFYQVLTWDGTKYVSPTTAEPGQGYWVLVMADTTVTVANGNPVESYERRFCGWRMIGSIITCTVDADCVFPDYYRLYSWDGFKYVEEAAIEPGKGYWALVLTCTYIVVDDSCCGP